MASSVPPLESTIFLWTGELHIADAWLEMLSYYFIKVKEEFEFDPFGDYATLPFKY